MLRREGWHVNIKRVYRLYKLEGLEVRTKKRRKRASHLRVVLPTPTAPNELWSMDFMRDTFDDGRPFRILTVMDTFTRECPLLAADTSLSGKRVAELLDAVRGGRRRVGSCWPKKKSSREPGA
jgi:putative transposase